MKPLGKSLGGRGLQGLLLGLCGIFLMQPQARAADLEPRLQQKVRTATFEVVVPKPASDPLTYEKPLPLDLLPYAVRNDQFEPSGTAFAFGKNQYLTAAHVLRLGFKTQREMPVLRDGAGKIYHIDKILKYSYHQDFVLFSLKEALTVTPLEANLKPATGETVYSVGNALGEGVVFRDGLYTSETPEEQDGRWKFLRFSAAASPGNSGGPLLDGKGKVLGIVLRKSSSENLNYALPIAEVVNAKANVAAIDTRTQMRLPIADTTERSTLKHEYPLPQSFEQLHTSLIALIDEDFDALLKQLLDKNAEVFFPRGSGSSQLLHVSRGSPFPTLIAKKADGNWDAEPQTKVARADLGHNGYLSYDQQKGMTLFLLRKPDDVSHEQFYRDSTVAGDLLLKGAAMNRMVGSERVRITSMSKAAQEIPFLDGYGRKWTLRSWPIAFGDSMACLMMLPTPEGYIGLYTQTATSLAHRQQALYKALANFMYLSYSGSLEQWRAFLDDSALQPAAFADIHIQYEYGKQFEFRSPRFAIKYGNDLQSIATDSGMMLRFSYFNDGGHTVWDVGGVSLRESVHRTGEFDVTRHIPPSNDMDDGPKRQWQRMQQHEHPFDAVASPNERDTTLIRAVWGSANYKGEPGSDKILYAAGILKEGSRDQAAMQASLDKFLKGLQVLEQ